MKLKALDDDNRESGLMLKSRFDQFNGKYEIAPQPPVFLNYPTDDLVNLPMFTFMQAEAKIVQAMCEFYAAHTDLPVIVRQSPSPSGLIASRKVGCGKFIIAIIGNVKHYSASEEATIPHKAHHVVNVAGRAFYIVPQVFKQPAFDGADEGKTCICPCNYVSTIDVEEEANLVVKSKKSGDFSLPYFTNPKTVDQGDRLCVYAEKSNNPEQKRMEHVSVHLDLDESKKKKAKKN